jgi:signal transduction histidine kinase
MSRNQEMGSAGLGLENLQTFVEAYGGRITAVSNDPGQGTTVRFELLRLVGDRFSGQSCTMRHDCPEMRLCVTKKGAN